MPIYNNFIGELLYDAKGKPLLEASKDAGITDKSYYR